MDTLFEVAIKSGAKKLDAEEEATMKWILDLPFTPIPGAALSYDRIDKLSPEQEELNIGD